MAYKDPEYQKKYYLEKKERFKEYYKEYWLKTKEITKEKRIENKEIIKAKRVLFYLENPNKRSEYNKTNYYKDISKTRAKAKKSSELLVNSIMKRRLIDSGLTKEQVQENPEIIEVKRLTILLKRELKKIQPIKN